MTPYFSNSTASDSSRLPSSFSGNLVMPALLLLTLLLLSYQSQAAITISPTLAGYTRNAATGAYLNNSAGNVSRILDAGLRYSTSGLVSISGNTITIPAKVPLAANAAVIAKSAMRLSPWLLAGTLALDYLTDNGITWDETHGFTKADPTVGTFPGGYAYKAPGSPGTRYYSPTLGVYTQVSYGNCMTPASMCSVEAAAVDYAKSFFGSASPGSHISDKPDTWQATSCAQQTATTYRCQISVQRHNGTYTSGYTVDVTKTSNPASPSRLPVTQADFDALPDPSPTIAPELPDAPYMPHGAPVDSPIYTDGRYPVGDPYKAPDGTTRQDHAHITNNTTINNSVTITMSSTVIQDAQGNPVTEPDTEQPPPEQTDCEKNPNTVGCSELGTLDGQPATGTFNLDFQPEADMLSATCPAPISVLGQSMSFQSACDAMVYIKPVVLVMASLLATFILFGSFRDS